MYIPGFPDTCVEIFFGYKNSNIARINGKGPFDSSKSFITSRMSRYMDVKLPPGSISIAVCFNPGAVFPFFHIPMNELTDENIKLEDLWRAKSNELEYTLSRYQNHEERVFVIQTFLLSFISRELSSRTAYKCCLQQIDQYKGQKPLKLLSKEINISQRQ